MVTKLPSTKPDGSTLPVKVGVLSSVLSPELSVPVIGATSSATEPIVGVTIGAVVSTRILILAVVLSLPAISIIFAR